MMEVRNEVYKARFLIVGIMEGTKLNAFEIEAFRGILYLVINIRNELFFARVK